MAEPMDLFPAEPETTREAIMKATYNALCEYGYADLTIQRIGDHFEKSKSLLYHHYDSKDALLVDFMTYMLERMEEKVPIEEKGDPYQQLQFGINFMLHELMGGENEDFLHALLEMRSQATHDESYCERFSENDDHLVGRYREIIDDGIEAGVFRDVEPELTAEMIFTTLSGAMIRHSTADSMDLDAVEGELSFYIRHRLLAADHPDAPGN